MRIRDFLHSSAALAAAAAIAAFAAGCDETPESHELSSVALTGPSEARGGPNAVEVGTVFEISGGPVYDIEAVPSGDILVPVTIPTGTGTGPTVVREIRTNGQDGVRTWGEISTPDGVPIQGLASVGRGDLYATRGGLDLAVGAGVVHATPAGDRLVGDIEAFEVANDPDLFVIDDWKDPQCAMASGPFTPGPQSNPFHLVGESGNTVIVGDAAGNTVLRVRSTGEVEVVAVFTPPAAGGGASVDSEDWLEFPFGGAGDGACYVQPVPNSVAIGPDGTIYAGELTGVDLTAPFVTPLGASRVWRIAPGTREAICPSDECEMILDGFTSIIDLEVGPDGDLWVVEYDENGWLAVVVPPIPTAGGTVNRCDLGTLACTEEMTGLTTPAAVTFDKWGGMWLLENNLAAPTVSRVQ